MWGARRSWVRNGCQCFSYCSDYSALAVAAALAANEIDYAGDTPAAIVTGITDPGYNAPLVPLIRLLTFKLSCHSIVLDFRLK
jgi:hypothetical protein